MRSIAAAGIMVCTLASQIPWDPVPDVISVVWISFAGILMTVLSASSSHLLRNLPDMSGADPVDTPCLDKGHFAYLEL